MKVSEKLSKMKFLSSEETAPKAATKRRTAGFWSLRALYKSAPRNLASEPSTVQHAAARMSFKAFNPAFEAPRKGP